MAGFFSFFVAMSLSASAITQDHNPSKVPDANESIAEIVDAERPQGAASQYQSHLACPWGKVETTSLRREPSCSDELP